MLVIMGGAVFPLQKRLMNRITAGLTMDGGTTGNILRIQG
jgi:hypothetical protein